MSTRREMIQQTIAAGLYAQTAGAAQTVAADSGWFDRPMRWAQLTLVEDDPANTISILARLFQAHAFRRGVPERGRVRRLLPHQDSAALLAASGSARTTRSAIWWQGAAS